MIISAQQHESNYNIGEVEVDILNSYYEQNGKHSAVEGGDGTQFLTDFVNSIKINIPFDSVNNISIDANYDTYTSASTDMIDWSVSGPSHHDERSYANIHYARILKKGNTLSVGGGFSTEWDVKSVSANAGWTKAFINDNHVIGFDINYIHDNWKFIFPTEINTDLNTHIRQTIGLNFSYAFVINKKMQAQLVYNLTIQDGLLSTPFHRVIFYTDTSGYSHLYNIKTDQSAYVLLGRNPQRDIERLPYSKIKHAFGLRSSNYISHWLILRAFYRYYYDSFGIQAHTVSFELPIKPTRFISFYPFYRFHTQTASDYFAPFLEHTTDEEYYTSDYDLSGFTSTKYGIGIKYSPALGIISLREVPFKRRASTFKAIEFRFGHYQRTDGLKAFIISSGLSFTF